MTKLYPWAAIGAVALLMFPGPVVGQTAQQTSENPSAYTALRLVGKTLGREALDRVVEVVGRDGVPQPYLWKIVLREGAGTREIDVAGGKIAAQRTVAHPVTGAAVRLQDLNLDSSGAFDATDAQARKVRLRFDSLNYTLQVNETTGKPQWRVELLNKEGANVGEMHLSANDGAIASIEGRLANNTPQPAADGAAPLNSTHSTTTTTTTVQTTGPAAVDGNVPEGVSEEGGFFVRAGRTLDKTTHTVERHLRAAGSTVQRFFTGRAGETDDEEKGDREDKPD